MIIEKTNRLTEDQLASILNLENTAFKEDALTNHAFLSNEINFNKEPPCFYMGYENNELVAFLTTFIPTSFEAEILAVTHPELQLIQVNNENRDIFTEITHDAFPELEGDSNFIDVVINSKNRKGFIVYKIGVPVGVFDYNYKVAHAFLYGLGIATPHRGKGFGKELVKAALIEGFKKSDKVVLDVDSINYKTPLKY